MLSFLTVISVYNNLFNRSRSVGLSNVPGRLGSILAPMVLYMVSLLFVMNIYLHILSNLHFLHKCICEIGKLSFYMFVDNIQI